MNQELPRDLPKPAGLRHRGSVGRTVGTFVVESLPDGRERWRPTDATTAEQRGQLERLLGSGIGGFARICDHKSGTSFERLAASPTLADHLKANNIPWRKAVEHVKHLFECLAACEREGLDPGPLTPKHISLASELHLRADPLLIQLCGGTPQTTGSTQPKLSRYLPPRQADGAPWDAAANRYVAGLILYRMLAGEDAFTQKSQGLRHALSQARQGAPPMAAAIVRQLPPGLHALVLRMLDPDPAQRPGSAAEVSQRLATFLRDGVQDTEDRSSRPTGVQKNIVSAKSFSQQSAISKPTATPPSTARKSSGLLLLIGAVAIGLSAAYLLIQSLPSAPPEPETPPRPPITAVTPLAPGQTGADTCQTCHPRQVHEWRRSVMGHSAKSPLFQALEMLIEEQVGRSDDCPHGAGILRRSDGVGACRDPQTGIAITGSGGALWCVNCHTPRENLDPKLAAWDGLSFAADRRRPLRDALPSGVMEGIDCGFCHQVKGPVAPGNESSGRYEGNPFWTSTQTGQRFSMRPEDFVGKPGIANSGYFLDPTIFLQGFGEPSEQLAGGVHRQLTDQRSREYLRSSEFCGSCHDVRIFGSDAIAARRGENFKRLRNAYSEWEAWAKTERAAGREPASCQDCHMSTYPGVCLPSDSVVDTPPASNTALARACPPGTTFSARAPGSYPEAGTATASAEGSTVTTHYFSGVDIPLASEFPDEWIEQHGLDAAGVPLGAAARRDILLGKTFRFEVDNPRRQGDQLQIPIVLENTGAGHRVPAGFSQEREFWVHLRVTDKAGDTVYEVGRIDRGDEDLRDKVFLRTNTDERVRDGQGRPLGVFGADVADGPDVPLWDPPPDHGGTAFRGRGLINLQNGFLRCVTCIGTIDREGRCQPLPGQETTRAGRFGDGNFDVDTGICTSNLFGENALFELYFPVGSLDASRGVIRGPDAIIDTRSAPPNVPLRYTYELATPGREGPFTVEARLMFRAFPPFLVRAFADYERRQAAAGLRPSGPLVTLDMLRRLEAIELHRVVTTVP